MPKLEPVERSIRRLKSRDPLSVSSHSEAAMVIVGIQSGRVRGGDDGAACCTAFFGFLRIGEIIVDGRAAHSRDTSHCVAVSDLAVDDRRSPSVLKIHLRHLKTDQHGRGVDVYLGCTGDELCPVSAVLAFLAMRGGAPGPLFMWSDGRFLTKATNVHARFLLSS